MHTASMGATAVRKVQSSVVDHHFAIPFAYFCKLQPVKQMQHGLAASFCRIQMGTEPHDQFALADRRAFQKGQQCF